MATNKKHLNIDEAEEAVKNGMSMHDASKKFGIPKTTSFH